MFGFFYSLVLALFKGTWLNYSSYEALENVGNAIGGFFKSLSYLFQSFFFNVHTEGLTDYNEIISTCQTISNNLATQTGRNFDEAISEFLPDMVAGILSTIVVIGLIVAVINIIKRIFTIFFQGVR